MAKDRIVWLPIHVDTGDLCITVKGPDYPNGPHCYEAQDVGSESNPNRLLGPGRLINNPPKEAPQKCLYGVANTWGRFKRTPVKGVVRKAVQRLVTVFEDITEEIG